MSTVTDVRELPADVYDALELSAEASGGIGGDAFSTGDYACQGTPICVFGHAAFLEGAGVGVGEVASALLKVGLYSSLNDFAVARINKRLGRAKDARVPFKSWCTELRVVRGDS